MSNILKKKSEENYKAAQFLKSTSAECFGSSVHCAYYSCIQKAKYLMIHVLGRKDDVEEVDNDKTRSIHTFLIHEIRNTFKNRSEIFKALDWNRSISNLKALRVEADYKEITIDEPKSSAAFAEAETIHRLLKYFEE